MNNAQDMRKRFGDCVQMFLEGKVSCDHLAGEYGGAQDPKLQAILKVIADRSRERGTFTVPTIAESGFAEKVMNLLRDLESD